jgi:LysM repeat protein
MDQRTRRSPARFLAPLALIAVLVAFLAIVTGSGSNGTSTPDTSSAATTTPTRGSSTSTKKATAKTKSGKATNGSNATRTYTVQIGDTLGGIANKTGVPLETIQSLNPSVDPHAMVAGQKIRLK